MTDLSIHAMELAKSRLQEQTARIEVLEEALKRTVDVMEIQEGRASGQYHISGEVMQGMWADALWVARAALNNKEQTHG